MDIKDVESVRAWLLKEIDEEMARKRSFLRQGEELGAAFADGCADAYVRFAWHFDVMDIDVLREHVARLDPESYDTTTLEEKLRKMEDGELDEPPDGE